MIPAPPGLATVITGMVYAFLMVTKRGEPGILTANTKAIWDALWFRYILTLGNAIYAIGLEKPEVIPLIVVIIIIDTLSYPIVSHFTLSIIDMGGRWRVFILAMTWVGNLRAVLMILAWIAFNYINPYGVLVLAGVAFWMLWATWSVASRSLGNRGFLGLAMVLVLMVVEVLNVGLLYART